MLFHLILARYIHGEYGKGQWTFYGGHDPWDIIFTLYTRYYINDGNTRWQ
ncbi:hypothetical protein N9K77_00495 [bacterium]|nr:hypothetical protein [bacterium]